jgi:hypothetical protein
MVAVAVQPHRYKQHGQPRLRGRENGIDMTNNVNVNVNVNAVCRAQPLYRRLAGMSPIIVAAQQLH